ncbi:WD repeat domain phosphoinositide-interacting protein [Entamoeba marina]
MSSHQVLCITSDPTCTSFAYGTVTGIHMFSLKNNVVKKQFQYGGGPTPLAPLTRVTILNESGSVGVLEYTSEVQQVLFSPKELYVLLPTRLYRYDTRSLMVLQSYEADGGKLTCSGDGEVVAFSVEKGSVAVGRRGNTKVIQCHKDVPEMSLNENGSLLVTSGNHGSFCRVWDTSSGKLMCEIKKKSHDVVMKSNLFGNLFITSSANGSLNVFALAKDYIGITEWCSLKIDSDGRRHIFIERDRAGCIISLSRKGVLTRLLIVEQNNKHTLTVVETVQLNLLK